MAFLERQPLLRTGHRYSVLVYTDEEKRDIEPDYSLSKEYKRYSYARAYAEKMSAQFKVRGFCELWDMENKDNSELYADPTDARETYVLGKLDSLL